MVFVYVFLLLVCMIIEIPISSLRFFSPNYFLTWYHSHRWENLKPLLCIFSSDFQTLFFSPCRCCQGWNSTVQPPVARTIATIGFTIIRSTDHWRPIAAGGLMHCHTPLRTFWLVVKRWRVGAHVSPEFCCPFPNICRCHCLAFCSRRMSQLAAIRH